LDNLNSLQKLKSLDFSNNRLTDIQGLENISSLESLKLDHNPITRLTPSFLSTLPSLRKLSMCGTSISALLPTIEALKTLPNLEDLSFHKYCDKKRNADLDDENTTHGDEEDADDEASNASATTTASNASIVTAASNASAVTAASSASAATNASATTANTSISTFSTLAHRDENDVG
jgi:Leucine-rich repeat (LRR) protein